MNHVEFLTETVYGADGTSLEQLKHMLSGKYIVYSFVKNDDVDAVILSEKLSDYFKMVGMKTFKTFDGKRQK